MRGKRAPKRVIELDPVYQSELVTRFINHVMRRGKKTVAQKIVYDALKKSAAETKKEPLPLLEEVIHNVAPVLEVKSRRIGGANYQVPIEVRGDRRQALAFRWLIEAAKKKGGMGMADALASEFVAAIKKEGDAMKKRDEVHRMAEANRAFAHFA